MKLLFTPTRNRGTRQAGWPEGAVQAERDLGDPRQASAVSPSARSRAIRPWYRQQAARLRSRQAEGPRHLPRRPRRRAGHRHATKDLSTGAVQEFKIAESTREAVAAWIKEAGCRNARISPVTPRAKKDRDAVCSSQAHSQTQSIAIARPQRRKRRILARRHCTEPAKAGQTGQPAASRGRIARNRIGRKEPKHSQTPQAIQHSGSSAARQPESSYAENWVTR